jgi:choline dehydrogenase-like flavoprotein
MMAVSSYPALKNVEEFLDTPLDYLVVGGGTAGLVVAARLIENPNIIVGVLEAGPAAMDDPAILTPAFFSTLFGNKDYDWSLKTVPQVYWFPSSFHRSRSRIGSER